MRGGKRNMSELKGPIEKYNHVGHVIKNVG